VSGESEGSSRVLKQGAHEFCFIGHYFYLQRSTEIPAFPFFPLLALILVPYNLSFSQPSFIQRGSRCPFSCMPSCCPVLTPLDRTCVERLEDSYCIYCSQLIPPIHTARHPKISVPLGERVLINYICYPANITPP